MIVSKDCLKFFSNYSKPINLGSSEQVSINKLIDIVENIANYKTKKLSA